MANDICGMLNVATLLRPGQTIAYETRLGGKPFIRYWLTYEGRLGRVRHGFAYVQTVAQGALGGRGQVENSGRLETTARFQPRLYSVRSGKDAFELRIGPRVARTRMPDGTQLVTQSDNPQVLLPSNSIAVIAVALALRREALQAADSLVLKCFVPDSMLPAIYRLDRRGGNWASNFGESLVFGPDGLLRTLEIPNQQVKVRRLSDASTPRKRRSTYIGPTHGRAPPLRAGDRSFSFTGPEGRVSGTISFPPKRQPLLAAVLFLGGSGVFDREGRTPGGFDIGYGRLFSAFVSRGLATARYDKPGTGGTAHGRSIDQHYDAVVETAACAFRQLQKRADLCGTPKILVGHSQGGLVVLELAGRLRPASIGLLATAATPLDQLILDQLRRQLRKTIAPLRMRRAMFKELRDFFDHVREGMVWNAERMPGNLYLKSRSVTWYREILARYPLELIRHVCAPMVIAQGEQDIQVPPRDANALAKAARSRNCAVTVLKFADLDHFFRKVHGSDPSKAYFDNRRKLDRRAADAIADALISTLPTP